MHICMFENFLDIMEFRVQKISRDFFVMLFILLTFVFILVELSIDIRLELRNKEGRHTVNQKTPNVKTDMYQVRITLGVKVGILLIN